MFDKRRAITAAVTLAVAFGTGYLMQNGGAVAARFAGGPEDPVANVPISELDADAVKAALPEVPADVRIPAFNTKSIVIHARRLAAIDSGFIAPTLTDAQTPTPFQLACKPELSVSPAPGAMIDIQLSAPCDANSRITIQHADLTFADATDADGSYAISVPALVEEAKVTILFDDGRSVDAATLILTLDGFTRSAIVWQGGEALHIHALEFGADYGDPGDVWANATRSPLDGLNAQGGFLTTLGDPAIHQPKLAEVYSFPADRMERDGAVRMMVEAEVTESTCGKSFTGNTIELGIDGDVRKVALELSMPDCDATGGYLMLNNLLQDLKVARY